MNGRGGCCIAQYAGGVPYDTSRVDRILLRFRPIAPKPASSGSVSGGSLLEKNEAGSRSTRRGKRRYNGSGKRNSSSDKRYSGRKRKAEGSEETDSVHKTSSGGELVSPEQVVTLPLLPETPDQRGPPAVETKKQPQTRPIWLDFSKNDNRDFTGLLHPSPGYDRTMAMALQRERRGECVVTMECVTDTWLEGYELGCTDQDRVANLVRDACPGFVSDGLDHVWWSNTAFKDMVGAGEVAVWLLVKGIAPPVTCAAFTCRVRVQFNSGKSMTTPCDVWRMDGGGFAWRLDVKAALSLGR